MFHSPLPLRLSPLLGSPEYALAMHVVITVFLGGFLASTIRTEESNRQEIGRLQDQKINLLDEAVKRRTEQLQRSVEGFNTRLAERASDALGNVPVVQSFTQIERDLTGWRWAPTVNISALTGRNVDKISKAIEAAAAGWETRISTGKLNAFLGRLAAAHPHPVRGGKQPRILFGTQAQNCPPTFALFTSGQFDDTYVRFIERRLREDFGFEGSPVHVEIRARTKHKDRA